MKKLVVLAMTVAALAATAIEFQFVEVVGSTRGIKGKVAALDVQSTNAAQTATFNRVRDIVAYTNALDITSRVVTNVVYFPETIITNGITNVVQGVSNVVSTVTTTNGYKKVVSARNCVTQTIAAVTCAGGFATTNVSAWLVKEDSIYVDCSDKAAKTTVVIER